MSDQENTSSMAAEQEQSHFEQTEHKDGMDAWWEKRTIPQKILTVIGFIILGAGLLFLLGWVVMLLWNWLMPEIFGLKTLTYWQAWGVLALSCILFGRIGGGGGKTAATGSGSASCAATSASKSRKMRKRRRRPPKNEPDAAPAAAA